YFSNQLRDDCQPLDRRGGAGLRMVRLEGSQCFFGCRLRCRQVFLEKRDRCGIGTRKQRDRPKRRVDGIEEAFLPAFGSDCGVYQLVIIEKLSGWRVARTISLRAVLAVPLGSDFPVRAPEYRLALSHS